MKETPFFFNNESYQLFGIIHEPVVEPKKFGFVFCHPFAEEKLWAHRVYVNFARKLAEIGYTVLRFDFYGHGDSDGEFKNSTVSTRLNDIRCALQMFRQTNTHIEEVGLLGLRMGATLAVLIAEKDPALNRLILWEPILNGAKYMKELFRINITTQTAVYKEVKYNSNILIEQLKDGKSINIDGYEIKFPLYEQLIDIDLFNSPKSFNGKVFVAQINRRDGMGSKRSKELGTLFQNASSLSVVEQPFWKEIKEYYSKAPNLYNATLNWLENS